MSDKQECSEDGMDGSDGQDSAHVVDGFDGHPLSPHLTDANSIALLLNKISDTHFSDEWLSTLLSGEGIDETLESDNSIRIRNLEIISERIVEYYREILGEDIDCSLVPDAHRLVTDGDVEQMDRLLRLVLGCVVSSDDKELIIDAIVDLNDQHLSSAVMNCLKSWTQMESKDCSDETIINRNNNLSEEEITNNPIIKVMNESMEEKTDSNSEISCPDIKAKESAQQMSTNTDLEIELNYKNDLFEENQKLMNENEKLKKLIERMNKTAVPIGDNSGEYNAEVIRMENRIECLQNENYKLKELKDNFLMQTEVMREELNHLKAIQCEPYVWSRNAMTGFCDHEFLYKLIASQLLFDNHRNLAINLLNSEKCKHMVPASDRLHNLVAIALKAEGDSPLSDDSIHPTNLIDLDFEADRNSGSSRASLYETTMNKEYFRGRSYSPDGDMSGGTALPQRMLDMGRMISKTSVLGEHPMQTLSHIPSNGSLGSRSTPDIAMPAFSHSMNNGLRSMTPNAMDGMGGQGAGMWRTDPNQGLDLNDLITQINLAQLVSMNADPSASMASSSANTPSPTPNTPSVPLQNGGLVLNEAALKNISQLAKLSVNEVQNGFMSNNSISPISMTSTMGRSSSTSGSKPNVMQIRCKFGQLGQQKGQFSSPHGFCLGVDEEIVIADTNNHRICIFDKSAEFKHSFGVPGKDEAQLWYPRKVAIIRTAIGGSGNSPPRYVICDRGAERSRMQIFTRSGHFVRKIAIRYIDIVAGLAITPNGKIVAVDSVSPTVFQIAETGELLKWFDCSEYMREPSDIAVNNNEYYICDFKGHCVVVFNEEGEYKRKIGCEGLTSFPNGIDVSDAGDVLVGDSHGNRFHVVVFDRMGSLISEFECPYVKVSRCCGLKITSEGYVVTLAKNNHHVLILNTLYIV